MKNSVDIFPPDTPITPVSVLQQRLDNLIDRFGILGIDSFLILSEEARRYFSGFCGQDGGISEPAAALLINKSTRILATDPRYTIQAAEEALLYSVVESSRGWIHAVCDALRDMGSRRIGFEAKRMPVFAMEKIKEKLSSTGFKATFIPADSLIEQVRMIKDKHEINLIREALSIAENAFTSMLTRLNEGITEKEAAWELEKEMREKGADGLAFPVIAAFGINTALPHAIPARSSLRKGIPVLFDWGARYSGYCSDTTRTFFYGNKDSMFEKVFTAVYEAHMMAVEAIRPGVTNKKIDRIARDHLKTKGLEKLFSHGLGHGVGLAVHETPSISQAADVIQIEENMVFTVEPGVYIPEWGGVRLENMVLVKNDSAEILNKLPLTVKEF